MEGAAVKTGKQCVNGLGQAEDSHHRANARGDQHAKVQAANAVHQGAKCAPQERPAFLGWLDDFEHDKLGLPRADLVLYLDMPTRCSLELLRSREAATHTQGDIHEVDPDYLAACRDSALQAARLLGWQVIPCVTGDGRLRTVEEIHREVWSLVSPLLNLN